MLYERPRHQEIIAVFGDVKRGQAGIGMDCIQKIVIGFQQVRYYGEISG